MTGSRNPSTLLVFQDPCGQENKATMLRRREVALARISIYIVFVFLLCHSVRIVPNTYEMITTYTEVKPGAYILFS